MAAAGARRRSVDALRGIGVAAMPVVDDAGDSSRRGRARPFRLACDDLINPR